MKEVEEVFIKKGFFSVIINLQWVVVLKNARRTKKFHGLRNLFNMTTFEEHDILLLILIIDQRNHMRLLKLSGLLKHFLQIINLMCDYGRFLIGNLNLFSI